MDLRCSEHLHARLVDGLIEVRCRWCAAIEGKGIIVLHYFDPVSGDHIKDQKFREPNSHTNTETKKEKV